MNAKVNLGGCGQTQNAVPLCVEQLNQSAYICIVAVTSHRVAPFGTGREIDNGERLKKKELHRNYSPESEDIRLNFEALKACKRG